MRRHRTTVAALAVVLAATGCGTDPGQRGKLDPPRSVTRLPASAVTVLDGDGAAELAVSVSRMLYEHAPAVVLADEDEPDAWQQAAGVAAELGIPLLLVPDGEGPSPEGELTRLAPDTVLTFGDGADRLARSMDGEVVVVPAAAGTTTTSGSPAPTASVPALAPPEPLPTLTVLARDEAQAAAAVATARAAGARVLVTSADDPRSDPEVIAALADQTPTHTVALGNRFGPVDQFRDRLAVAATGVQLPGGGQLVFPGRRFVALYGHPGDPVLGALGEQGLAGAVERARRVAAEYESLVEEPVVPAFEIIATVASASAEPTGDYSRRTPPGELVAWVEAAREAGIYVLLDLQPGHTDFLTQAKEFEDLLREPHVGLALDPEWRLAPGQRHMVQIGSVSADEVNQVVDWLADLTARHRLPQKLLVVHQFTHSMISNRTEIDTGRDELAVMIHADGFGTPGQKRHTWESLHSDAPDVWWGWKNFYDEDRPTFTPAETVAVEPSPRFISYQ